MRQYINVRRRWVAVYWPKIQAWDFYQILKSGRPRDNQPQIVAFTPIFSEAVTTARSEGHKIPASGWDKARTNLAGVSDCKLVPIEIWKTAKPANK